MNIRRLLVWFGLAGATVIVVASFHQFGNLGSALQGMHWYLIPLLVATQIVSYGANAGYYRAFFDITGNVVGWRKLFEVSLAINFANQAVPAGGIAGTTLLAKSLQGEIPTGQATLSQVGRYGFTLASYAVIVLLGLVLLMTSADSGRVSVRLVILGTFMTFVGVVAAGAVITRRHRLERVVSNGARVLNLISRRLGRSSELIPPSRLLSFFDEFYAAYDELSHHRGTQLKLLAWSLLYNVCEVLSVYVVFVGLGVCVNLGIVIAGYTLAIIASIAGVFTNGIGVYELGMVGAFTSLGIPISIATAVVLVYRALSLIAFLPPGAYYYRKYLQFKPASLP